MNVMALLALTAPWLNPFAGGPMPAMQPWLAAISCAAVLFGAQGIARSPLATPTLVAQAWLVAALVSAGGGLIQYFGYGEAFLPWVNQAGPGEAFGNLRQRNQFATLMGIGLLALTWKATGRRATGGVVVAIVLLSLGNAASGSRTGTLQWVGIAALAAFWSVPGGRRPLRITVAALGTYGVALLMLPPLLMLLTGTSTGGVLGRFSEQGGCASRLVLWSNVLELMAQKPWLGWGWGELDYAHYMTLYPGARFCDILDNAHNLPLHMAVELGIPLALAVCVGAGWVVWRAKPWRETDPTRQMAWGVLAVIMLHSMLEYPLWYGPFQMAFGLCVWMLWPAPREPMTGSRPYAGAAAAIRLVVVTALLAAVAYAAWDYHRISQLYLAPQARDPAYRNDTLNKVRGSWLFRNQVEFAELTTTSLRPGNAQWTFDTATALLHYSPEPRVIEKVIESAVMLGRDDEALLHLVRYRAAFPDDYTKWRHANGLTGGPAD
ncbi:MAG: polymerase [Polaromonas sp. 39-63-25]|nr:MAG: polymerase [Polaromonas sp. 35-63-35]OYZ21333.1 MAG: polymerase [Polaromonas sp. 16-63-31]OYZ79192.1 MAG: polymerase [Polaromonas sp. 24-63-21]OZA50247.1 MAG: polymerase [Polaromonas sp. 17-63-33]OZA89362.1 MAG: polymerase [Polaromonas sp. 39-63-25]